MPQLFAASLAGDSLPTGQLREAVQSHTTRLFTGMLEIGEFGGGYLNFLFSSGQIISLYARNPAGLIALTPENWGQIIPSHLHSRHSTSTICFSPRAVQLARIRLAQANQGQSFTHLPTTSLAEKFSIWLERPEPALLHVRWMSADGLVYISGQKHEAHQVVLLSNGQDMPEKMTLADLTAWPEAEYSVSVLGHIPNDAWELYILNVAFTRLIEKLLKRYSEVTGRVLVNSVVRGLNLDCATKSLDLNVINGQVVDRMVFVQLDKAVSVYRELMALIFQQMATLVGKNVVMLISKDVLAELDNACLRVIESHQIIPDAAFPVFLHRGVP